MISGLTEGSTGIPSSTPYSKKEQLQSSRGAETGCPERLWMPRPWRCSRPGWMGPWAAWPSIKCGGRWPGMWGGRLELHDPWGLFQPRPFCDSVILWSATFIIVTIFLFCPIKLSLFHAMSSYLHYNLWNISQGYRMIVKHGRPNSLKRNFYL